MPLQTEINQLTRQFWVTKEQVKANKYDLAGSRYRQVEQDQQYYEQTAVTLRRLRQLQYRDLLDAFVVAASGGDCSQLGAVSTACSRLGQRVEVFNPALDSVIAICETERCLGVARSFTGTILTVLLLPTDPQLITKVRRVRSAFMRLSKARPFVSATEPYRVY